MVIWGTLLQRRVPPALLGRVSSLDFFVSLSLHAAVDGPGRPVSELIGLTATFLARRPRSRRCWRSSRSSPPGCRPTRSPTRSTCPAEPVDDEPAASDAEAEPV